ncbi:MAG: PilZ domain-containing protein [Gammaproteobacteria bacterium]|nr:PilZ domain-containing protein [Gammaproteobacteria bacterium]
MNESETEQNERRDYFRIEDRLYLSYECITDEDYLKSPEILSQSGESSFSLTASFATLNHENNHLLSNIKRTTPEIAQYLAMLNQKIDSLGKHLLESSMELSQNNLVDANISASGIAFTARKSLDKNQALRIKIVLMPEKIGILTYGRVINCTQDNVQNGFIISLDFEHILDNDRELLIKHNLNKQMIELRKRSTEQKKPD